MNLFDEGTNWPDAFVPLIQKYNGKQHPLHYQNIYQLLVMVVLSAQDNDAHINKIAPDFFNRYPTMQSLSKANTAALTEALSSVRFHANKIAWLQDIASVVKTDEDIPVTMKELTALKGVGRKSANVIMREAGAEAEGVVVDLHVLRVAPRIGISHGKNADQVEKDIMKNLPKEMWGEAGMSISFLGREICRPSNPKHNECVMRNHCEYVIKNPV